MVQRMTVGSTEELVSRAARAIARRDSRGLRTVIAQLDEHISPRLTVIAIAAAQALDRGDVVRAFQLWDPYAEACLSAARPSPPS
jgi:hypothetical protein